MFYHTADARSGPMEIENNLFWDGSNKFRQRHGAVVNPSVETIESRISEEEEMIPKQKKREVATTTSDGGRTNTGTTAFFPSPSSLYMREYHFPNLEI